MNSKVVKADQCPNCEEPLKGENFCPNCGQKNDIRKLTFWHFLTESVSHFLAFDGKFFNTLRKLATKPGQVPLDYINGQRTTYMNPLRIYFLSSLLLLFLSQIQSNRSKERIKEVLANEQLSESARDSIVTTELDAEPGLPFNLIIDSTAESEVLNKLDEMTNYSKEHPNSSASAALKDLQEENTLMNRFLYHQADKISHFELDEFNRYFRSKIFWVLFFFLPIIALLLKLLYFRSSFYYTDHLFFAFYNQSVFFLLLSISSALGDDSRFTLIASIGFLIYLLISMKRFYAQGFGKTILKFSLLNLISIPAFFAFFLVSLLVVFLLF